MHRLEIKITGEVPEDEMERARVLAHPSVTAAMAELASALNEAGVAKCVVNTRSIKPSEGRARGRKRGQPAVVRAAE